MTAHIGEQLESRNGIGSNKMVPVRKIPKLELCEHDICINLNGVNVVMADQPYFPPVFGVVGEDFLGEGFDLDFRLMNFSLMNPK